MTPDDFSSTWTSPTIPQRTTCSGWSISAFFLSESGGSHPKWFYAEDIMRIAHNEE
jgi:hypothetical protein